MLCPKRHGLALSDDTGLLSFYSRVKTTYHNGYANPLENLSCRAANLLMKTGTMKTSFGRPKPHSPWPTDPSKNLATTFCLYHCPIPRYPFRLLAPWHRARLAGTLGRSLDYPHAGIIPHNTDFRVLLRRETRVPYIMMLHPGRQEDGMACGNSKKLTQTETQAWHQFSALDSSTKLKKYYEVTYVKQHLRKLSLVVKRLLFLSSSPSPWP